MTGKDERREKELFAACGLFPMLHAATGGYVEDCRYEAEGAEETVRVWHGAGGCYVLDVNVAGDSPWAMAKDVMRAVEEVYG